MRLSPEQVVAIRTGVSLVADSRPSLETVLTPARSYGLAPVRAKQVVEEVASAVYSWRDAARKAAIAAGDVELTAGAFSAHSEYRALRPN